MTSELLTEEEARIELWKRTYFVELGFSSSEVEHLVSWKVDPHDAQRLLWRGRERTACTHEQALRILEP